MTTASSASSSAASAASAAPPGPTRIPTPARPSGSGGPPDFSWANLFKYDLPSSLVVFLVAVPLGLGIALASGAPVVSGLIGCVVGGIVVGTLGGAPMQVTGPAAGLTVLVAGFVLKFGWPAMLAITIAAGAIQVILGVMKVGRACLAISPAVVHGMLAGIGVIIALAQAQVMLGGAPESSALRNLVLLPKHVMAMHPHSAMLGALTLGVLAAWTYAPKAWQRVPGALLAVLAGTLVSLHPAFADVARVKLPANLWAFTVPVIPDDFDGFLGAALSVALVASVESLLCAVAADKLHQGPRANLDRELTGQGVANMVSGALGGLPLTGVVVRTAANIEAGARTRASAILHGVWVLAFVVLLGSSIQRIPLPVLAGLLVFVGVRLVNLHHIRELATHREGLVYWVTLIGVAALNLLEGVGIGIALSVVMVLRRMGQASFELEDRGARWHLRATGALTFLGVPRLTEALARIPRGTRVDVDLAVDFMDHAAFDALHGWRVNHEKGGGSVDIDESHESWYGRAASGKPLTKTETNRDRGRPAGLRGFLKRGPMRNIADLLDGALRSRRMSSGDMKPLLSELAAEGQHPTFLFIGCADSRVVPHYITASNPGDLFKLRNVGNLVPPCVDPESPASAGADHSVGATVEFAIEALGIANIIVCGHSQCGAMKALVTGGPGEGLPHLKAWLAHGAPSVNRLHGRDGEVADEALHPADRLAMVNVLQQLDHLRGYSPVAKALAAGKLNLYGWYFDIEKAELRMYNESTHRFVAVDDDHVEELLAGRVAA